MKESAARPAHFVRLADRYAVPFTLVAYPIAGVAWFVSKSPTRFAEVLVVASPCPLILSAPIALVAGWVVQVVMGSLLNRERWSKN